MPEGPEVRRYADMLDAAIAGEPIVAIAARTKGARAWLEERGSALVGRRVERVRSRGKHVVGRIEGGAFFHSHLMMWGRWEIVEPGALVADRRERARIVTPRAAAVLLSAPVFEIGEGDPFREVERLALLGPDALPYPDEPPFDAKGFLRRLTAPESRDREIGVALLDQTVVAGVGNYLRAEVLWECRIDPWRRIRDLKPRERACLAEAVHAVTRRAYELGGATASDAARERMRTDERLVYQAGREYGTRHNVFRRTNLPCLECGDTVRQLRQVTRADDEGEKSRITYFCPTCQGVAVAPKRAPRRRPAAAVRD